MHPPPRTLAIGQFVAYRAASDRVIMKIRFTFNVLYNITHVLPWHGTMYQGCGLGAMPDRVEDVADLNRLTGRQVALVEARLRRG